MQQFQVWENSIEQIIIVNGRPIKSLKENGTTRKIKHILVRCVIYCILKTHVRKKEWKNFFFNFYEKQVCPTSLTKSDHFLSKESSLGSGSWKETACFFGNYVQAQKSSSSLPMTICTLWISLHKHKRTLSSQASKQHGKI
jgi:hypothetical protein